MPLQQALLGDDGVFYGAVFVAVFNLFVWSYGLVMMSGDIKQVSPKKIITNPGIIGVIIGMIIFFAQISIPEVISKLIGYSSWGLGVGKGRWEQYKLQAV